MISSISESGTEDFFAEMMYFCVAGSYEISENIHKYKLVFFEISKYNFSMLKVVFMILNRHVKNLTIDD